MPAIDLTKEAKSLFSKRYYGTGSYGYGYNTGYSRWHKYRWLLFLLILIPIAFLVCFFWGCRWLQKRNRRRIDNGTAPVETWDPNNPQGGNAGYYNANQQQQQQYQAGAGGQGYGDNNTYAGENNQNYNKEAGDLHSSNASQPTYENNHVPQTQQGYTNTNNVANEVEYPNQTYQRPSGAPPGSTY